MQWIKKLLIFGILLYFFIILPRTSVSAIDLWPFNNRPSVTPTTTPYQFPTPYLTGTIFPTSSMNPTPSTYLSSNCSSVIITEGNNQNAPTTGRFIVSGYDNNGNIRQYSIEYGDGNTDTNTTGNFTHIYNTSGVYTVRGGIVDSQNNLRNQNSACMVTFNATNTYQNTNPPTIYTQPGTGLPTVVTVIAMISAIGSTLLWGALEKREHNTNETN